MRPPEPEIYYPIAQNVTMASDIGMSLLVRTAGPPEPMAGAIRAAVREVSPASAMFNVGRWTRCARTRSGSCGSIAGWSACLRRSRSSLAAIGLHGVIAYNVTSRACASSRSGWRSARIRRG